MSLAISRALRVSLIVAALIAGLSLGGVGYRSIARADDPPASAPATEPTAEQLVANTHEDFQEIAEMLGGFNDDQKAKLAVLEKTVDDQIRIDITKFRDDSFTKFVMAQFRDILTPDQQKKFDAQVEKHKADLETMTSRNLQTIRSSCLLYVHENKSKYAPDLGTLAVAEGDGPFSVLVADSKTKVPAEADWNTMNAAAKADWMNKNTDFVYLGGGQTSRIPATFVIAYIKPEAARAHNFFLMGDGSIVSKTAEEAKPIIADLQAGKNPPASMGTN